MEEAREMFRDKERTELVIVTIPTVMAMAESERLAESLEKEHVPCKRIVVNQMVSPKVPFACCRMRSVMLLQLFKPPHAAGPYGGCLWQTGSAQVFGAKICLCPAGSQVPRADVGDRVCRSTTRQRSSS